MSRKYDFHVEAFVPSVGRWRRLHTWETWSAADLDVRVLRGEQRTKRKANPHHVPVSYRVKKDEIALPSNQPSAPVSIPADQVLHMVTRLMQFPYAQICRHAVAADLLDLLERNGWPLTSELAHAVVFAEDDEALSILEKIRSEAS